MIVRFSDKKPGRADDKPFPSTYKDLDKSKKPKIHYLVMGGASSQEGFFDQVISGGAMYALSDWSAFLLRLPVLEADVLLISHPENLLADRSFFVEGLFLFKKRNPNSTVIVECQFPENSQEVFLLHALFKNKKIDGINRDDPVSFNVSDGVA